MSDEHSAAPLAAQPPSFPVGAVVWLLIALVGVSAPFLLETGIAHTAVEWLLKGSGGHGQGWQALGAVALCISLMHMLQWAALRFNLKLLAYLAVFIALAVAIGIAIFAVVLTWAGLADTIGNGFVGGFLLLLIAGAVGVVVLAAHRSQAAPAVFDKLSFLQDWAWSLAMVIGGLVASLLASFVIGGLLLGMTEHQLLPSSLSGSILVTRRHVFVLVWLALQTFWIVAMTAWIYRFGIERAVEAFRFAVINGLLSLLLSFISTIALFALGPPL
jgi:hypothetical protein